MEYGVRRTAQPSTLTRGPAGDAITSYYTHCRKHLRGAICPILGSTRLLVLTDEGWLFPHNHRYSGSLFVLRLPTQ